MIPPEHLNPFKSFINSYMTSKMSFSNEQPAKAEINSDALLHAIGSNETGGVKTDPYAFSQPSGSKKQGNALGKYQVTEGELKTYGSRFLGAPVDSGTFLKNPGLQDTYMKSKAQYLNRTYGWSPEQIMAAHRGGFGNPANISATMKKYQPYVTKGMDAYNNPPIASKQQ